MFFQLGSAMRARSLSDASHSHLASARWPFRQVHCKPFKRFPLVADRTTWLKPSVNESETQKPLAYSG